MKLLENIRTVSAYERKTLFRSWFFRIFAILSLLFLFGINMGFFGSQSDAEWTLRAIAANIPYINVLFINVAQAVIAIFLASEFIKRDKKLDTTEVIYTRPISNGEYVIGKTLGIISLFVGVVILALAMALIFNLIRLDTPVIWKAYIYYPLLITFPTLVFILGLSFFLMILLRSQAVTFLILLGYIGLSLFYFKDKLNGLLDYMAFNLPMVYSDFTGFSNLDKILLHRLTYLFLGTGFIFATIRFLGRLPQTGRWNALNLAGFLIFISLGAFFGYRFHATYLEEINNREKFLKLNDMYAGYIIPDILSNSISLEHYGHKISASSEIAIQNPAGVIMDTLLFSLNPGLKIDSIISRSGPLQYIRQSQILQVIPKEPVYPGRRTRLTICYSGIPDKSIAYLDIPQKQLGALKSIQVATLDKEPGIISPEFLLLTKELLWYPIAGTGFNLRTFLPSQIDFVRYTLSVKPSRGLVPVSQGAMEFQDDRYLFTPDTDLNALSLIIGPFEKRSIQIDGLECNIYLKPGHDFFSEYFTHIADTVASVIESEKDDYEREELDLYYPFKRISLVEVPIQFHAYERPFMLTTEMIQPEMVLIPEKGAGLNTVDFARFSYYEQRISKKREKARSDREIEIDQLKHFLQGTFFRSENRSRPASGVFMQGGEDLIQFKGHNYSRNPFCVFPLYYSYMTGISSVDYSMFNSMLEIYLKEGFEVSPRQSFMGGMSDAERANLALKNHAMVEIFARNKTGLTASLLTQTGSYIILALKNRVGSSEFDNFLYYYIEDNAFTAIPFEKFRSDFLKEFNVDIEPYFNVIRSTNNLPVFQISTPEFIRSRDEIGEVYLIRFRISNEGESRGLIDVTLRMPGQGGFGPGGGGMDSEHRIYEVEAGTTKDIQITLYDAPRMITINTLISGNIPSSFSTFLRSAENIKNAELEEYERTIDGVQSANLDGEYIVDNEDPGFSFVNVSNQSKLKKFLDSRKDESDQIRYDGINPWRAPGKWTPVAHTGFYGKIIRSALLSANGDGGNIAKWSTILPEAGFYDVMVYIPMSAMLGRPTGKGRGGGDRGEERGGRKEGQDGRSGGPNFGDQGFDYHYLVTSGAGSEEVEFLLNNVVEGWNKIGSFYFPADTAAIELSNKTGGKRVFADAVKWVKKPG